MAPSSINSRARSGGTCRALKRPSPFLTATVVSRTEQLGRLAADRGVTGHEQDRAAPLAAEGGVDPGFPDRCSVEPELAPGLAGDGVRHDAVRCSGLRVHADEQRGVAALLEQLCVFRPVVLDDVLAGRVELVRDQGIEGPLAARAVTVHDHDLGRAGGLRASNGGVDLLGVQLAAFVVGTFLHGSVGCCHLTIPATPSMSLTTKTFMPDRIT